MKNANLLIDCETFRWETHQDISAEIDEFMLALGKAKEEKDKIFNSPNFWVLRISDRGFIGIITNHSTTKETFPWLHPRNREFIVRQLMNYGTTPSNSTNLDNLDVEFEGENNGLMVIGQTNTSRHVFDISSWYLIHANYLRSHPQFIIWDKNPVLPFLEYSNRFILEIVQRERPDINGVDEMLEYFEYELIRSYRNNRASLQELARNIATANGYAENAQLSSQERNLQQGSQRLIFEIEKENTKQYVSLDFENGQFEVHDPNGRHLGVWNLSGRKTREADSSGDHDILTLRN